MPWWKFMACHEKAISSLILESPPAWITVADRVQAQKADPTINQVITWMENKKLETVKNGWRNVAWAEAISEAKGEAMFAGRGSV